MLCRHFISRLSLNSTHTKSHRPTYNENSKLTCFNRKIISHGLWWHSHIDRWLGEGISMCSKKRQDKITDKIGYTPLRQRLLSNYILNTHAFNVSLDIPAQVYMRDQETEQRFIFFNILSDNYDEPLIRNDILWTIFETYCGTLCERRLPLTHITSWINQNHPWCVYKMLMFSFQKTDVLRLISTVSHHKKFCCRFITPLTGVGPLHCDCHNCHPKWLCHSSWWENNEWPPLGFLVKGRWGHDTSTEPMNHSLNTS